MIGCYVKSSSTITEGSVTVENDMVSSDSELRLSGSDSDHTLEALESEIAADWWCFG